MPATPKSTITNTATSAPRSPSAADGRCSVPRFVVSPGIKRASSMLGALPSGCGPVGRWVRIRWTRPLPRGLSRSAAGRTEE